MAYEKTVWVNGQAPALNAENLNKMEQGIANATQSAERAEAAINNVLYDQTLSPEGDNDIYVDFSGIDFTKYRNVKIFIDRNSSSVQANIYFLYEKGTPVQPNYFGITKIIIGTSVSHEKTQGSVYIHKSAVINLLAAINTPNSKEIYFRFFGFGNYNFVKCSFGLNLSGTGPNFWGIRISDQGNAPVTAHIRVTGDKIE